MYISQKFNPISTFLPTEIIFVKNQDNEIQIIILNN